MVEPASARAPEKSPNQSRHAVIGVMFDLDGTLVDTAPDMAAALNRQLRQHGHGPLPAEVIRPTVSHGSAAMLALAFGVTPKHPGFQELRREFLDIYRTVLDQESALFPGMSRVLARLEDERIPWGVVTNKPAWLTGPLLDHLGLSERAVCVVSGDTLDKNKPAPDPVLHACALADRDPTRCLYVGDAERDIAAGRAAGLTTLAALFGYLSSTDQPENWGADGLIRQPEEILDWIRTEES